VQQQPDSLPGNPSPFTPPASTRYPGAQTTAATPSALGLPDTNTNPYGGTPTPPATTTPAPAPNPFANDPNGQQAGTKILDAYDDPYTRRDTYGGSDPTRKAISSALVSSGNPYLMAAGAVGYLDAWLHRKADTAPTDFSVADATEIIKSAYKDFNGRDATPEEVQAALAGQGLKPGDRWVGQSGIRGVLGHIYQNAAQTEGTPVNVGQAGPGATTPAGASSATTPGATGTPGATPPGSSATAPAGASGGGSMDYLEGFDRDKFNDPNKSDPKYDFAHLVGGLPPTPATLDAQWDNIKAKFPNATRTGTGSIDFGTGEGSVDVIRAAGDGGKAWHWEPESDASDTSSSTAAPTATTPITPTTPGAGVGLAAPLADSTVAQQIQDELQRIIRGEQPRAAILKQMGLA
jgi:hypothetical protein